MVVLYLPRGPLNLTLPWGSTTLRAADQIIDGLLNKIKLNFRRPFMDTGHPFGTRLKGYSDPFKITFESSMNM